jgi:murein DD-endopeptidase MepM/ murein hydrolase activator NlpD
VTAATINAAELPPAPTYISLSDPDLLPRAETGAPAVVTVRPGDTVYAISRRTGASPDAIIAENRLRAPYQLEVGQTLIIPSPERKIANSITERAPVRTEVRTEVRAAPPSSRVHVVRAGDTLYSISRSTGVSVNLLAQSNNLRPPYSLGVGQTLIVPGDGGAVQTTNAPIQREASAPRDVENLARSVSYTAPAATTSDPARLFEWPVKGAIIGKYGDGVKGRRNDGMNIAAPVGTPVRAAAAGEVVYRGSELDGYGNLLLIKHDDGFVTAYAHNDVMLVKKGQRVNQGQVIAKVGQTGAASEPQLHFEIRQNLKSVDPLGFLQN